MGFRVKRVEEIFRGRVFRLVSKEVVLPDGRETTLNVVEHPGAVAIVPRFGNGDFLLIRQFRGSVGEELYEVPAGTLEPGERPEATARRELVEETGFKARSMKKVGAFYTAPGFCTELMHLFEARGLTPSRAEGDEDEVIRPVRVAAKRAVDLVRRGKIRDAKSIVGVLLSHVRR